MAIISGTGGKDTITLAIASAGVVGGPATDAADSIFGLLGNDLVEAGGGDDRVSGDLKQFDAGRAGSDVVRGEGGDDVITGDASVMSGTGLRGGADKLDGGDGDDLILGDASALSDGAFGGNDLIEGGSGDDVLVGDAIDIAVNSGCGNDILRGDDGDDQLFGDRQVQLADPVLDLEQVKAGKDQLFGGDGDDLLVGGGLADKLSGGEGLDVFGFRPGSGKDNVLDFVSGQDLLDIQSYELDFTAMDSNADGVIDDGDDFAKQIGTKLILDLGAASGFAAKVDTVTLLGVNELVSDDIAR